MMLTTQRFTGSNVISSGQGGIPQKFVVDSDGNINYPMFGKINVLDMSRMQLADSIASMLENNGYIKDPVINVIISNFKISVLGEVLRPGIYNIDSERVTILEAISKAGDLSIYGKRNKVKLIRENNVTCIVKELDLIISSILTSPEYYFIQNDVIYVVPNYVKAPARPNGTFWGALCCV